MDILWGTFDHYSNVPPLPPQYSFQIYRRWKHET